jgi:hypothetical protein
MNRSRLRSIRLVAPLVALALLGVACGSDDNNQAAPQQETEQSNKQGGTADEAAVATGPDSPAAQLRSTLTGAFQEHVVLAASATGAALGGRTEEFTAAAGALDANSNSLTEAISGIFGAEAGKAFDPLWKKHIGFVVDYTQGLAAKDQAKQDKAVADLVAYTKDFGAFLNSALPELPADAVAELVKTHILTLKDVIDAQAAGDQVQAYTNLRAAAHHMGMIAEPLAGAIAKQFPDKAGGDPASPGAGLVTTLNSALSEHVTLAASATGAALGGRADEFTAAAGALEGNSNDITAAIAGVYGPEAGKAFDPLWKKHIGFVVDYTQGLGARDKAKQDKAVADLVAYTNDFGAFLNSASPELPPATVADLVKTHILTLKDVIDAQAAKDYTKAYTNLRSSAHHMSMIANPLATTIVKQFPEKF